MVFSTNDFLRLLQNKKIVPNSVIMQVFLQQSSTEAEERDRHGKEGCNFC